VLLVREHSKKQYSLPGGGFKKGETTIATAVREIYEELGAKCYLVRRLENCDYKGKWAFHKVCQIALLDNNHPFIKAKNEIDDSIWWNMKDRIPVQHHVKAILNKMGLIPHT